MIVLNATDPGVAPDQRQNFIDMYKSQKRYLLGEINEEQFKRGQIQGVSKMIETRAQTEGRRGCMALLMIAASVGMGLLITMSALMILIGVNLG
jgi:hypothetical protein